MLVKQAALIGLGMVAPTYIAALRDLERDGTVRLRGVHARSGDSRQSFIRQHGPGLLDYASVEEIAGDPEVDFAILVTPPNARLEAVRTLAGAGKPILMEKPVERTVEAAKTLCRICRDRGLPLGITLQHRMRPAVIELRERIANENFGPLCAFEISLPWWRPQSYYDEPGRGTYARDGGGVMISQAIHILDLALSFMPPVASVSAMAETTELHAMESEDFVIAGLRLEGGATGSFFATTAAFPGRTEEIHLHFREASIALVGNRFTIAGHDGSQRAGGESPDEKAGTGSGANPMAFTHEWHRSIILDFAEALDSGREPLVSGDKALAVHRVIEAIERSAREGKRVTLGG